MGVGRYVDETLRLLQAFQFVEKHGEVPGRLEARREDHEGRPQGLPGLLLRRQLSLRLDLLLWHHAFNACVISRPLRRSFSRIPQIECELNPTAPPELAIITQARVRG